MRRHGRQAVHVTVVECSGQVGEQTAGRGVVPECAVEDAPCVSGASVGNLPEPSGVLALHAAEEGKAVREALGRDEGIGALDVVWVTKADVLVGAGGGGASDGLGNERDVDLNMLGEAGVSTRS